jgi:hypothetical protein
MAKKTNIIKAILGLGILGGAAYGINYLIKAIKTKQTADKLDYDFRDIKNVRLDGQYVKFDLGVNVTNPSANDLIINQIYLKVFVADSTAPLASISNKQEIKIPANSQKVLNLPFSTASLISQLQNVPTIIKIIKGESDKSLTLKGTIRVNNFLAPINETIKFNVG